MTHYRCTENGRVRLKPQTACGCYCMTVWPYCEMSAGTDVRAGELPAVPDASNGINRRVLLVPDRGNGSTGLLRGVPLTVYPARSSDSLSRKRPKMRSSPQQQRRGLDRQATLHTIYEEKKTANMEVIAENTLRNSYEKRLKKYQIRFVLYAFWERGDDELLHVQRRMHPEAPESSRKAERLRIKPGDSNIKVIY